MFALGMALYYILFKAYPYKKIESEQISENENAYLKSQ